MSTNIEIAMNTSLFNSLLGGKLSCTEREQNPFADSRFCHNGGGYSQPAGEIFFGGCQVGWYSDTSCGDFGTRFDGKIGSMEVHIDTVDGMPDECVNIHPSWARHFMQMILHLPLAK